MELKVFMDEDLKTLLPPTDFRTPMELLKI